MVCFVIDWSLDGVPGLFLSRIAIVRLKGQSLDGQSDNWVNWWFALLK